MALLDLPSELIFQIFDLVGESYFREDTRRLAVCKKWHSLVLYFLLTDLKLSWEAVNSLTHSPGRDARLDLLKSVMVTADIKLHGNLNLLPPHNFSGQKLSTDGRRHEEYLDESLAELATTLKECKKFNGLYITARRARTYIMQSYLYADTISLFLRTTRLTFLTLDLHGTPLIHRESEGSRTHLCPIIANLLPTLRRLHLRMRCLCTDVLSPPVTTE